MILNQSHIFCQVNKYILTILKTGPFVLSFYNKRIESDLAYAGLNSDHVGIIVRTELAHKAASLKVS